MQLPTLARVKLDRLIAREQEARDAASSVTRRASDLGRALATAPASDAATIEAELSRLRARQADLAAKHRNLADLNAAITHWLSSATGTLEYVKPAKAALQKGETISAAILRLRGRIQELTKERVKVMQAGIPIADLKAQATEHVNRLVERGKPKITYGHTQDFRVLFNAVVDGAWTSQQDIAAALAWLDPDGLKRRLNEAIDQLPQPTFTLSGKARAERLIGLEAELLRCEREEEALIEASEEGEGPLIIRRLNADPRAVLCLGTIQPKAAKPEGKMERVKASDAA